MKMLIDCSWTRSAAKKNVVPLVFPVTTPVEFENDGEGLKNIAENKADELLAKAARELIWHQEREYVLAKRIIVPKEHLVQAFATEIASYDATDAAHLSLLEFLVSKASPEEVNMMLNIATRWGNDIAVNVALPKASPAGRFAALRAEAKSQMYEPGNSKAHRLIEMYEATLTAKDVAGQLPP